jgi:hypothetical protein
MTLVALAVAALALACSSKDKEREQPPSPREQQRRYDLSERERHAPIIASLRDELAAATELKAIRLVDEQPTGDWFPISGENRDLLVRLVGELAWQPEPTCMIIPGIRVLASRPKGTTTVELCLSCGHLTSSGLVALQLFIGNDAESFATWAQKVFNDPSIRAFDED